MGTTSEPITQPPLTVGRKKLSSLVDPTLEADIAPAGPAETRQKYAHFDSTQGGVPCKAEKPSGDQLKALETLLINDAVPYTDFSLWIPHGKRAQKALKLMAFIQTGPGEFAHRLLPGPNCWETWRASWRISAMPC